MVDKIKPLKIETAIDGTESDPFPRESDPTEDYIATKGVAFENYDNRLIDIIDGNIQFTDTSGVVTIAELKAQSLGSLFTKGFIDEAQTYILLTDYQYITYDRVILNGHLVIDGDMVVFD